MRSIALAFLMFSRIPVPRVAWDERNRRYALAAFPAVGVAIGLLLLLFQALCGWLKFNSIFWAAGLTLLPVWISGGIHMDGFADTVDARASHAEPERRRAILKDPHAGAFAVIAVGCYLLGYCALAAQLPQSPRTAWTLLFLHALSRTGSGLSSLLFPGIGEGLLHSFRSGRGVRLLTTWAVALSLALMLLRGPAYLLLPLSAALPAAYVGRVARKEFGGMSGDLSGYYLQSAELLMLALLALLERGSI